MKVMPASVHFLANVGFSLNYIGVSFDPSALAWGCSYKAVSGMYALTALLFRNLYYPVAIQVCRGIPEVDCVGRAQSMLRSGIWVGV